MTEALSSRHSERRRRVFEDRGVQAECASGMTGRHIERSEISSCV